MEVLLWSLGLNSGVEEPNEVICDVLTKNIGVSGCLYSRSIDGE